MTKRYYLKKGKKELKFKERKPMFEFIVFADNHIGVYEGSSVDEQTGLNTRLIDCLSVWDDVMSYARLKKIKVIAFLGDRFRSTNPEGYIRDLADEKLKAMSSEFTLLCLVGNHDYYKKSSFYHSYGVAHIFEESFRGLTLIDKPTVTPIVHHSGQINFWGLPFGHDLINQDFSRHFDTDQFNVLLFHHDVIGTKYPSGHAVETGLDMKSLSAFDLVLGGHIHLAQKFADVKGGYVGSVTQLKRDDAGVDKGFWHFKIDPDIKTVDSNLVRSKAPEYVVKEITFEKGDEYKALFKDNELEGNYFYLRARGNRAVLSTVNTGLIEKELIENLNLRFCKVELEVERGTEFKYEELQESKNVDDEVDFLIGKEDTTGLDKGELKEVGLWISKEVA